MQSVVDKKETITSEAAEGLKEVFKLFAFELLGLEESQSANNPEREEAFGKVVDLILEQRRKAKENKDWATSDLIRNELASYGFEIKDTKDGSTWKLNK